MPKSERLLAHGMTVVVVALLLVVAVLVVWPLVPITSTMKKGDGERTQVSPTYSGVVTRIDEQGVVVAEDGLEHPYQVLAVRLTSGDRAGEVVRVEDGLAVSRTAETQFRVGDKVYLDPVSSADGERWLISEYSRGKPLLIVGLGFVLLVLLVGSSQGLRSLFGVALSVAVIFLFVVPQIIAGREPLAVSLLAAVFIVVASTYLTFGLSVKAHTAVAGMLVSLAVTAVLAEYALDLTRLSGLGSEESGNLIVDLGPAISVRGILLGGILIGTLGVLDDMCVSQASTVFELAAANRELTGLGLFRRGLNVGRDHISACVNTLVLAYAGASLPLFVLFGLYQEPMLQRLSREPITEEIVRSLIGSIGLVVAVPVTTLIASLVATIHLQQREALLDDVVAALNRRERWRVPDLAEEVGRSETIVVSALEELASQGYLHPLTWGDCRGDCGGCGLRVACLVGFGGRAWARSTVQLGPPEAQPSPPVAPASGS